VSTRTHSGWSARTSLCFVLLFGAINPFANMTCEGTRSVTGPFLGVFGASGLVVAHVPGNPGVPVYIHGPRC
jgi:hypothetical protein